MWLLGKLWEQTDDFNDVMSVGLGWNDRRRNSLAGPEALELANQRVGGADRIAANCVDWRSADGGCDSGLLVQRVRRLGDRFRGDSVYSQGADEMTDIRIFGEPILFHLGPVPITETMVTSTAVSAVLLGGALVMRTYTRAHPQSAIATIIVLQNGGAR